MKLIDIKQASFCVGFLFVFCLVSSCDKEKDCPKGSHDSIAIKNNSSVIVNWMMEDDPKNATWQNNGSTEYPSISEGVIDAGGTRQVGADQCWEYLYSGGVKQYYFIFSHDTVKAIGWEKIKGTNRGLLKRVLVDLDYLQKNNFAISYP